MNMVANVVLATMFFLLLISHFLFSLFLLFFFLFVIFFPPLPTVEIVAQDYTGTLCGKVGL